MVRLEQSLVLYSRILGRNAGNGLEDSAQRTVPRIQSLIHGDGCVTVTEYTVACHFTDNRISRSKLSDLICRNLKNEISQIWAEQISRIHAVINRYAELVAERHLAYGNGDSASLNDIGCLYSSRLHILVHSSVQVHDLIIDRKLVLILRDTDPYQLVACILQLRCDHIL